MQFKKKAHKSENYNHPILHIREVNNFSTKIFLDKFTSFLNENKDNFNKKDHGTTLCFIFVKKSQTLKIKRELELIFQKKFKVFDRSDFLFITCY